MSCACCPVIARLTLALGLLLLPASAAGQGEDPSQTSRGRAWGELELGPDTTIYGSPLRTDGAVDYAAALNRELSEGVTSENNAFVALLRIMPIQGWDSEHRRRTFEALGMPDQTGEEPGRFVPFEAFVGEPFAGVQWQPDDESVEEFQERLKAAKPEHERRYEQAQRQPWTAEQFPLIAGWLAANADALDALQRAVSRPQYWAPVITTGDTGVLLEARLPQLLAQRDLAKAVKIRANLQLADGQPDAAWRDVMTLQRLGRLPGHEPFLISGLVGTSIRHMTVDLVAAIAGDPDLTPQQARGMLAEFQALPPVPDWRGSLRAERLMLPDVLVRLWAAADDALRLEQLGEMIVPEVRWGGLGRVMGHPLFDINHALRRCSRHWSRSTSAYDAGSLPKMARQMEAERARWDAWLAQAADQFEEQMLQGQILDEVKDLAPDQARRRVTDLVTDLLIGVLWAGMDTAVLVHETDAMGQDLGRVALALAAYRAEHGDYPATLDALVPAYLGELPPDRFAEAPLHYERTQDAVILYSIGRDFEDDGGADEASEGGVVVRLKR